MDRFLFREIVSSPPRAAELRKTACLCRSLGRSESCQFAGCREMAVGLVSALVSNWTDVGSERGSPCAYARAVTRTCPRIPFRRCGNAVDYAFRVLGVALGQSGEEELREGFPSWGAARSDPGGAPRGLAGTAAQEAQAPARRPGLQLPLLPQAVAFSRHTAHDLRAPGPGTAALGPVGTAADFRCGGLRQAQRGRRAGAPVSDPSQRSSYPATRQTDRRRA